MRRAILLTISLLLAGTATSQDNRLDLNGLLYQPKQLFGVPLVALWGLESETRKENLTAALAPVGHQRLTLVIMEATTGKDLSKYLAHHLTAYHGEGTGLARLNAESETILEVLNHVRQWEYLGPGSVLSIEMGPVGRSTQFSLNGELIATSSSPEHFSSIWLPAWWIRPLDSMPKTKAMYSPDEIDPRLAEKWKESLDLWGVSSPQT